MKQRRYFEILSIEQVLERLKGAPGKENLQMQPKKKKGKLQKLRRLKIKKKEVYQIKIKVVQVRRVGNICCLSEGNGP